MGCIYSHMKMEKEEIVSRCRSRRHYMKQMVRSRHAFSAAHFAYLRSLRAIGSALLQFATAELHHHSPPLPPPPPSPPPPPPVPQPPKHNRHTPMSPISDAWTSVSQSPVLVPPPPPPASSWDFWDPFMPSSSRVVTEEEWEGTASVSDSAVTTTAASATTPLPPPPPPSASVTTASAYSKETSELVVVVSRSTKDLVGIIKELDEYFLKASDAGKHVSELLEVPNSSFQHGSPATTVTATTKVYHSGWSLSSPRSWTRGTNSKWRAMSDYGSYSQEMIGTDVHESHRSTVERLYAWEKKLYQEVMSGEAIKKKHDKKCEGLRKQEIKGTNFLKIEKYRKEIEKLASRMMVASQAMHTTSAEIVRLREDELFPQLLELVKGLTYMWRSMYECHQVQTHIVQQLKFLNIIIGTEPTSDFQRQSTLQLELEVRQWHSAFCNLIKSQRDYMQSLIGWLHLSLFQVNSLTFVKLQQNPPIYSLCEEWQLALDRFPDKVASEGIKCFLAVVHAVVVQQSEELKQKKRSEVASKELDKKMTSLRALECKYGSYSMSHMQMPSAFAKDPIAEKRAKVEILRRKAEDERNKYLKSVSVTRAMTANNLQTGFPNVFQAMTGFASVCMQAFESVSNRAKNMDEVHGVKMLT